MAYSTAVLAVITNSEFPTSTVELFCKSPSDLQRDDPGPAEPRERDAGPAGGRQRSGRGPRAAGGGGRVHRGRPAAPETGEPAEDMRTHGRQ